MSSSLDVDMPPREATPGNAHDPAELRVDQVIERIFPAQTLGRLFFTRFLERAAQEHTVLPDEPPDSIAILTRSIATLGKELNIGHDTTQKYVVIYRSLGLMKKRKVMGQLAFVLRTGIYQPPEMLEANLDALLAQYKRVKLRGIVELVKERCIIYGLISQDLLASLQQLQTLLQPGRAESRRSLEQRLLQSQRLVIQMVRSLQNSPRLPKPSSSVDATWNLPATGYIGEEQSTQTGAAGRREHPSVAKKLPKLPHRVDSRQLRLAKEATQTATSGRFQQVISAAPLPKTSHQVDSSTANANQPAAEATQTATSGRIELEHVSSNLSAVRRWVDSSTPPNVNVSIYTIIVSLNVNVSPVVEYLRSIFEEAPTKRGYYHNLYNKQQCQNAEAWLAAAIETLIAFHQTKTIREPGKFFIDRCVLLHRSGIPPDTAAHVQRYGGLSYPQLLKALKQSEPTRSSPPAHQPALMSAPRGSPIQRRLPRDKVHPGMSRDDFQQMLALMEGDVRTCDLQVQPYQQADGSCALLVDDGMGHQRWVYSLCDWQEDCAAMRTTLDLFSHDKGT
jgi:hypothetical protein